MVIKEHYAAPAIEVVEPDFEGVICISGETVENGTSGLQDYIRQDGQEW